MADVFVSYARADRERVAILADKLEAAGFSVWWDRHIEAGAEFSADIERELMNAGAVVACWSAAGNASRWVKDEADAAAQAGKLLALTLDEQLPPLGFRQYHALDFSGWRGDEESAVFQDLTRAVRRRNTAPAVPAKTGRPGKSIAVLPFVNMSSDPEQEYFSDGVAEELINALMKLDKLKVAGRTSSFSFKGRSVSLQSIGDELGVAHILEGSVRKHGDRVRISAQLVAAGDGFNLWSETYDRKLDDIFAIQDEIARAIASELSVRLGDRAGAIVPRATRDDEAYQNFLQGRYVLRQRYGADGGAMLDRAIGFFEEALERDPEFARAWSSLSLAYVWAPQYTDINIDESFDKARECARRASDLDPAIGEHYAGLSVLCIYTREYVKGVEHGLRGVELEPGDATVQRVAGSAYLLYGYLKGGAAYFREAARIDPTSGMEAVWAAESLYHIGDEKGAEEMALRALDLGCSFANRLLSEIAWRRGKAQEAGERYVATVHFNNRIPRDKAVEMAVAAFGEEKEHARAAAMLDDYLNGPDVRITEFIIVLLIKIGRYDQAADLFLANKTDHEDAILLEFWSPGNAAFRRSDAFQKIIKGTDLSPLWKERGAPDLARAEGDGFVFD